MAYTEAEAEAEEEVEEQPEKQSQVRGKAEEDYGANRTTVGDEGFDESDDLAF